MYCIGKRYHSAEIVVGLHWHFLTFTLSLQPVRARRYHAVMGQLVVHGVRERGRFVLIDRHRRVVREVCLVQHREHRVSWFLSSTDDQNWF